MNQSIRQLFSAIFGEQRFDAWLGAVDCIFHRQPSTGFGGPLNGSLARLAVFNELKRRCSFAAAGCPVYTSEVNARYLGYAQVRLWPRSNVHFCLGDSRQFLRRLIQDSSVPKGSVFFYLDAHWHDDLPLREEVDLIFRHWTRPVVMVDDFQVPDDSGYLYDDYGEGKKLSLDYLNPVAHIGFIPFFPVLPSSDEIGLKRGWVVLASDGYSIGQLRAVTQLREWRQPKG